MVTGQQDVGHVKLAPGPWPGIGRSFDQPAHGACALTGTERVVRGRLGVPEHAGNQPADGLDHHQDGRFAAGQDVVADRELADGHPAPRVLHDPLVDPFVPATGEHQVIYSGQLSRHCLGEERPGGRRHDQLGRSRGLAGGNRVRGRGQAGYGVDGLAPRLRLHHHAGTAAERRIINGPVHVMSPGAQIMHGDDDFSALHGLADQRDVERGKKFRKYGNNIDPHSRLHSASLVQPRLSYPPSPRTTPRNPANVP